MHIPALFASDTGFTFAEHPVAERSVVVPHLPFQISLTHV